MLSRRAHEPAQGWRSAALEADHAAAHGVAAGDDRSHQQAGDEIDSHRGRFATTIDKRNLLHRVIDPVVIPLPKIHASPSVTDA